MTGERQREEARSNVRHRWVILMLMGGACLTGRSEDQLHPIHQQEHHHRRYEGSYYPGPYYSRAYIQTFELEPGDRALLYRLRPFQHYGRYEYGCPIEPGLTNGTVESYRFPYRYQWGFQATRAPQPSSVDNCDHPLARKYRSIDAGPSHSADDPAESPLPGASPRGASGTSNAPVALPR